MNPYIKLPKVPIVFGRQQVILAKCKDKRVLHLGCVDQGYLSERFERGELMHQRLANVSKELWGVDIDEKGIEFLRKRGFRNLLVGDICALQDIEPIRNRLFDTIVASEVMEHLQNPGLFLKTVRGFMDPGKTELIVTVPNAFRIDTLIWLFRRVEYVHPDHHYWFSYHTATHLLKENGFRVEEVYVYSFKPIRISQFMTRRLARDGVKEENRLTVKKTPFSLPFKQVVTWMCSLPGLLVSAVLLRINPFWGDGIIIVARISSHALK